MCPYRILDYLVAILIIFGGVITAILLNDVLSPNKTEEQKYDATIRAAAIKQYQNEKTEAANKRILEIEKELRTPKTKPLDERVHEHYEKYLKERWKR